MGFGGMFSAQASPIAMDFGSASVKLLQIGPGDRAALLAAADLPVPDAIRTDLDKQFAFYGEWLPKILREGRFKGRRIMIAIPGSQTFVQHMQITEAESLNRDEAIKAQLQAQMGVSPSGVVVRSMEVCPVHRNGQARTEMICFAIAKETVMRYVDLLHKCKLEVVGVHTDVIAMIRAFDHINRRVEDVNVTTMYVDLGWGGTRVAITHGKQVMFARYIPIGGKHFDQLIANSLHCDIAGARAHRLSLQGAMAHAAQAAVLAGQRASESQGAAILNVAMASAESDSRSKAAATATATATAMEERRVGMLPAVLSKPVPPGEAPRHAVNVDISELLDTVTDELSMGLRYHQGLFRDRPINRAIFVGGESRQAWLCQHIVKVLRVPAQMGDPLARLDATNPPATPNLTLGQPQPGWAVACGLCTAPTDL